MRVPRKGRLHALLVGMQIGAATVENSMEAICSCLDTARRNREAEILSYPSMKTAHIGGGVSPTDRIKVVVGRGRCRVAK